MLRAFLLATGKVSLLAIGAVSPGVSLLATGAVS